MLFIDKLIEKIIKLKAPIVVGLDPILDMIPDVYKSESVDGNERFKTPGSVIFDFNKDIIDAVVDYVPAVKPQIAYYEAYGIDGLIAFQKTVQYAQEKGLIVIEDAKRNDIGSSAQAYAEGHLGHSISVDGKQKITLFNVDCMTVNPYLGSDGIEPFTKVCDSENKGIFVLVKTSNRSSGDFQDKVYSDGTTLYETVAEYVSKVSEKRKGKYNYSSIGAVVGATYPEQSTKLRKSMKSSYFLVPGYGQQGGTSKDVLPCFDENGLGALVNSSRGILYSYINKYDTRTVSRQQLREEVIVSVKEMIEDIVGCLRENYVDMYY